MYSVNRRLCQIAVSPPDGHVADCRVDAHRRGGGHQVHALVVRVTINDRESAQRRLNEEVVPRVSQAQGFQAGYWTWKDDVGLSMTIFDSEDAASQAADRVRALVRDFDAVGLEEVDVREVVAHA
jgi:hypothetical protein